jgi:hypothetical protein
MGPIGSMITGMRTRALVDTNFRRELEKNPKQVLERELGRELSKEELSAALAELKKQGIETKPTRS